MRPFPGPLGVPCGPDVQSHRMSVLSITHAALLSVLAVLVCVSMLRGFCRCSRCEASRHSQFPGVAADDWQAFSDRSATMYALNTTYHHHTSANETFRQNHSWVLWPPLEPDPVQDPIPAGAGAAVPVSARGPTPAAGVGPVRGPAAALGVAPAQGPAITPAALDNADGAEPMDVDPVDDPAASPPTAYQAAKQQRKSRLPGNDGAARSSGRQLGQLPSQWRGECR